MKATVTSATGSATHEVEILVEPSKTCSGSALIGGKFYFVFLTTNGFDFQESGKDELSCTEVWGSAKRPMCTCTCRDFQFRGGKGKACKHINVSLLLAKW